MQIINWAKYVTNRFWLRLLAVLAIAAYGAMQLEASRGDWDQLQQFFAAQEAQGTRFLDPRVDPPLGRVVKYDQNPILLPPEPTPEICHPVVTSLNGTLYLSYVNYLTRNPGPPASLGMATSTDGLQWQHYTGNPILTTSSSGWDSWRVGYHSIVQAGDTYYMYYSGGQAGSSYQGIGLATSTDLLHWEKYSANPLLTTQGSGWESAMVLVPSVYIESGTWYMYYMGRNSEGTGTIGLATSSDGVNWNRHGPVITSDMNTWERNQVFPQNIIKYGNQYYMFYAGGDDSYYCIGIATSPDLLHWTKYQENPVLTVGPPGSWDAWITDHVFCMPLGDKYWVWYSGNDLPNGSGTQAIGLGFLVAPLPEPGTIVMANIAGLSLLLGAMLNRRQANKKG